MFYVTFKINIGGKHKAKKQIEFSETVFDNRFCPRYLSLGNMGWYYGNDARYFFLGLKAKRKIAKIKMNKQTMKTPK